MDSTRSERFDRPITGVYRVAPLRGICGWRMAMARGGGLCLDQRNTDPNLQLEEALAQVRRMYAGARIAGLEDGVRTAVVGIGGCR